jgi:dihydrofolate reductase
LPESLSPAAIALVVAVAENGVIGAAGGLPWRLKADLRRFRAVTMSKPIVMGRKTWESIGRPLDGRDNIVVTRRQGLAPEGVLVARTVTEALHEAAERAKQRGAGEICVIGGGEVFAAVMPLAERLYATHIAAAPEGDVRFPEISPKDWIEISREALPFSDGDTVEGTYVVYQRRN